MAKIFISQEVLDTLFAEGKAELTGTELTIHTRHQTFALEPAVKFLGVAGQGPDGLALVGKIFAQGELTKMKADLYMDSAIVNEVAYQVAPGFLGLPLGAPATDSAQSSASDSELLSEYLLKVL